jgi:hypothetical protein
MPITITGGIFWLLFRVQGGCIPGYRCWSTRIHSSWVCCHTFLADRDHAQIRLLGNKRDPKVSSEASGALREGAHMWPNVQIALL